MVSLHAPTTRRSLSHIRTTEGCWDLGLRHLEGTEAAETRSSSVRGTQTGWLVDLPDHLCGRSCPFDVHFAQSFLQTEAPVRPPQLRPRPLRAAAHLQVGQAGPQVSCLREQSQVLIAEGDGHVDNAASLRTETWGVLETHREDVRQVGDSSSPVRPSVRPSYHSSAGGVVQDIEFSSTGHQDFGLSVLGQDHPAGRLPLET